MRMWLVNPKILCIKHLCGEYRELFTFVGTLKKQCSLNGYFDHNCLEPLSIQTRYEELKQELIRRAKLRGKTTKYKVLELDSSVLNYLGDKKFIKVNKTNSLKLLLERCPKCKKRYELLRNNKLEEIEKAVGNRDK